MGPIRVTRSSTGFALQACLPGVERPAWPATAVPAETRALVNGAVAVTSDAPLLWSTPPLPSHGVSPDPSCAAGFGTSIVLSLDALATVGVVPPAAGDWVVFEIELRVQVQGRTLVGERSVELGAGPTVGEVTSIDISSAGAHIRGWAVDPNSTSATRLRVTVDGRDWLLRTLNPPEPGEAVKWRHLDDVRTHVRDPDPKWARRGISEWRGFDLTVPHGRVCVYVFAPDPAGTFELERTSQLLGCRTSPISGRPSATLSATVGPVRGLATNANADVTVRGIGFDPWAGRDPVQREVMVQLKGGGHSGWGTVRARPDLPSVMPDGSGRFDFVATVRSMYPGRHTFCAYLSQHATPNWWRVWAPANATGHGEELGCFSVVVPLGPVSPRGNLERVTATGRVVTVSGWALDQNGGSPKVLITRGGALAGLTQPNRARPDVARLLGGDGRAGFEASIGAPPGEHQVCVAWQDTTTGAWSSPMCSSVVVK